DESDSNLVQIMIKNYVLYKLIKNF
ncbi:hypothetical protein LCGC14_2620070, partial [marine sediment metagenome]